jgi:hypothetical protein
VDTPCGTEKETEIYWKSLAHRGHIAIQHGDAVKAADCWCVCVCDGDETAPLFVGLPNDASTDWSADFIDLLEDMTLLYGI